MCLSYKGQGKRNIEDVHDFVFRMPTLEYRNKTWSNLDLALQLKKDFVRALISHAGAIVSNKFSYHKSSKLQQNRLREIANLSSFVSPSGSGLNSETSSLKESISTEPLGGRPSTASARPSTLKRSISLDSTPSVSSTTDLRTEEDTSTPANGQPNGDATPRRAMSPSKSSPQGADAEVSLGGSNLTQRRSQTDELQSSRPRAASISRHFSGFGERFRQRQTESSNEDTEENSRKSKLLLGGQKLLRTLRDQ